MKFLRNLSIRRKLMAITMAVSSVALMVACAAFMAYQQTAAEKQMVEALNITAAMTAANSTAGLSFDEAGSVEEALKSLRMQPDIIQACIYDKDGRVFARYIRKAAQPGSPPPPVTAAGTRFSGHQLELFQPIALAQETIGTIYLEEDLSQMTRRLWQGVETCALVLLACAGLSFFLSASLQKVIAKPLSDLAETVAIVRTKKDYAVRAVRTRDDELGSLIDGFNDMLAQIQERDAHLERRVTERTQALAESLSVLRESQARFKFIFESAPVGIASHLVHPDGRVLREINDAHLRICGLTREQHDLPEIYAKLTHPADLARQQDLMRQVNEGQLRQFSLEKRYLRLDGTMVWVAFSYQRQHYADGGFEELTTIADITESKRAEEALRESEANYYSLVDQMPAGIFRKDKEGRFVFVNSWFCRFRGAKPEDFLGKTPEEAGTAITGTGQVLPAEAINLFSAGTKHHTMILETGRPVEVEEEYHLPGDRTIYHHVIKTPVFGPDGTVVGSQGILMDITQRKLAEAELAYERDLLRTMLDNSADSIYFKDTQSRVIRASTAMARRCGLASATEARGKSDFDFFTEEHARAAFDDEQEIIRTGQPMIGKAEREIWKDGRTESWVLTTKMPFRNREGEIIGTFGISKDITAIKLAEAELAYERDLLRTLLDNSTDHIYFKDAQSRFIKSSTSQARQFGVASADDLVGKCDFDFFSEEHARPAFEDEQEIIRTGQPMIGRIERETWKDGRKETWVLTTKIPFRNPAGEIIGTFGISKDITVIKEAEAQLEIAHQKLLETSRLAGMAEVATSVLHNVGNVLNSVNVSTTLVLELVKKSRLSNLGRLAELIAGQQDNLANFFAADPRGIQLPGYLTKLAEHLAGEQAELVAEIQLTRQNVEHIKDIVTMQQNYAKVSGVVEKVKVTDLVEDALRMNAGALHRHRVELVRDYPASAIDCNIERQKVLQILVNLIRNAKYACDESGRPDKCLTMQVRAGDGRVQITTMDNGVGIPVENMTRIFNHGFTTRATGHGFGLHSAALAAKELGGSLAAHSDGPGTGARFVLDLPLKPPQNL